MADIEIEQLDAELQEAIEHFNEKGKGGTKPSPGHVNHKVYVSVPVSEKDKVHWTRAARHLGISRAELIRVAVNKLLHDNGLWTMRGPLRTPKSYAKFPQKPPKLDLDEIREAIPDD